MPATAGTRPTPRSRAAANARVCTPSQCRMMLAIIAPARASLMHRMHDQLCAVRIGGRDTFVLVLCEGMPHYSSVSANALPPRNSSESGYPPTYKPGSSCLFGVEMITSCESATKVKLKSLDSSSSVLIKPLRTWSAKRSWLMMYVGRPCSFSRTTASSTTTASRCQSSRASSSSSFWACMIRQRATAPMECRTLHSSWRSIQ